MDMFADPMAELLARIEALEAAVFAKAAKPAKESPEALGEAWAQWEAYRKGRGWTANARALNMRKIRELAGTDGALALKIVNQSIERGWTGLFPLKDAPQAAPQPVKHKTVAEALAPTETPLQARIGWLRQQAQLMDWTPEKLGEEIAKARNPIGYVCETMNPNGGVEEGGRAAQDLGSQPRRTKWDGALER